MMDDFYIVETDKTTYLGRIEFIEGAILVKNGFQGRPTRIEADDINSMYPALWHPAVMPIKDPSR